MSKAAKQSVVILIIMLIGSLIYTGVTLLEKQKIDDAKKEIEAKLGQAQAQEQKLENTNKQLQNELNQMKDEKERIDRDLKSVQDKAADLNSRIDEITGDRNKWKDRVDQLVKERNDLIEKLKEKPKVIYKEREPEPQPTQPIPQPTLSPAPSSQPTVVTIESSTPSQTVVQRPSDEEYWAEVLRDKAALEIEIGKLKEELTQKSVEVVEMKQANKDLELQLETLQHQKEDMEREIQFKADLVNNISLELARTKNDKKFVASSVEKINDENSELRNELKRLVKTNNALEKEIIKIKGDKEKIEGSLGQAEELIQSKIDEIWEIKESLDRSFQSAKQGLPQPNEVELPPIVVSTKGSALTFDEGRTSPGFEGQVISINEEHNFVIVNLGEGDDIRLGEQLSVYRDNRYIARLEVIQVRSDVCAADLKDQWTRIQVGDTVK